MAKPVVQNELLSEQTCTGSGSQTFLGGMIYKFPMAAITSNHLMAWYNTNKSAYCSGHQNSKMGHWAKIKVLATLCPFSEALEESLSPCFLQLWEKAGIPGLLALSVFRACNCLL